MYEIRTDEREFILEPDDIRDFLYEFLATAPHEHIDGISFDDDARLDTVQWKDKNILLTFTQ